MARLLENGGNFYLADVAAAAANIAFFLILFGDNAVSLTLTARIGTTAACWTDANCQSRSLA